MSPTRQMPLDLAGGHHAARKGWHTWPGMPFEQLELL